MKIIGHRGARGLAPENTIEGLQKGLSYNISEVEFDLRITKDDVVILHHNPTIFDTNGSEHKISDTTFKDLLEHKPDIITFTQALDTINRKVPMYVEIKPGVETEPITKIINEYLAKGWQNSDFYLASYSWKVLSEFERDLPEIGKIVNEKWSGVRASRRARKLNTKRVSMLDTWLWFGYVSAVSRRGYELYCFPSQSPKKATFMAKFGLNSDVTNNPKKSAKWAKYGLAGVITDYPDRYQK